MKLTIIQKLRKYLDFKKKQTYFVRVTGIFFNYNFTVKDDHSG